MAAAFSGGPGQLSPPPSSPPTSSCSTKGSRLALPDGALSAGPGGAARTRPAWEHRIPSPGDVAERCRREWGETRCSLRGEGGGFPRQCPPHAVKRCGPFKWRRVPVPGGGRC